MAQKKMTIVEQYDKAIALLNGETVEGYTIADAVKFLAERSAQTAKKNASGGGGERKPTKTQLENEGIKEQIVAVLATAEKPMNIAEMRKADSTLPESSQKMTSLLTQLVKANTIVRTEVKGRAYFGLPTAE
jgi:hypothetical protein